MEFTFDKEFNSIHKHFKDLEELQARNEALQKERIQRAKDLKLDIPNPKKDEDSIKEISELMKVDEFTWNCLDLVKCSQLLYPQEPCRFLVFYPKGEIFDFIGHEKRINEKDIIDCDIDGPFICPRWIDYIDNKITESRKVV